MASFAYTVAKTELLKGTIDLHTTGADVRVILVMTSTTANTERDKLTISGFATLDECDGAGYARVALTTETVTQVDGTSYWGMFDADNVTFTAVSLGISLRSIQGALVYKHVTNDTDSIPLFWIDTGGFPFAANGSNIVITWAAGGVAQLT